MVRKRALQLLLIGTTTWLVVSCSGAGKAEPGPSSTGSPDAPVIALITTDSGAVADAMLTTANDIARRAGFSVRPFTPNSVSSVEQARFLGAAIAARARAIVIAPVNYAALLPYLRAAHDAQIPVVVMQTPRTRLNPTFVASFVSPVQGALDDDAAAELARSTQGDGEVAVISATPATQTSGSSATGVRSSLRKMRSDLQVLAVTIDAGNTVTAEAQVRRLFTSRPNLSAVVAVDALATQALRAPLESLGDRRPKVILTILSSTGLTLLGDSVVDAVIAADTCALTRTAFANAVVAARNDVPAIKSSAVVPVRTLTQATLSSFAHCS
jgi:ABC-type sugar transport system substrate-binding protein